MKPQNSPLAKNLDKLKKLQNRKSLQDPDGPSLEIPPRVIAEFSAKALVGNYRAIQELVPKQMLLPMIKANAYGHGAVWAAENLMDEKGLYGFGVATLEEAKELRDELGPEARNLKIVIVSGCVPWTEEKGHFCEAYGLTPIIGSDEDWTRFLKGGWPGRIPYHLKFNTGMNRLGINPAFSSQVIRSLKALPGDSQPEGVGSHLAMGEDPTHALSLQQLDRFKALRREFSSVCPAALFHLANSSAVWNQKYWGLDGMTDFVRPGISLYGVPPWQGAPARGLTAVMTLKVSVIMTRRLKVGESLGYSGTFKVPGPKKGQKEEAVHVALVSAGYADGLNRALGNSGHALLNQRLQKFLGIVSMDLGAIECSPQTKVGEWAQVLGPEMDPWIQARAANTIPYELLTSVSRRVKRIYG
ncbi:MAG: alanine racemase [Methylotenera sp.]|nr:alanine racemase [Oligoflexia bacterium]